MIRRSSLLVSIAAASCLAALVNASGCSSSDDPPGAGPKTDTGTTGGDTSPGASCTSGTIDRDNPPDPCGPDTTLPKCRSASEIATCPTDTACMASAKQSGDVLSYRMGRIKLWAPEALLSLSALAVDPNVNPKCFNNGNESFNWLLQVDKKNNTLTTGGAPINPAHNNFAFSERKVLGSELDAVCPGFVGPAETDLKKVVVPITFSGNKFSSSEIAKINIPIFEGTVPIILPIQQGFIKNVTISADNNCIGAFNKDYWCDGDSLGWTTGGTIVGKITVEDADKVPVKTAGCQSLCAILANDSSKVSGKLCKRGSDGKIPNIGDAKVSVDNDAFQLSATFAAFGVTIAGTPPPDPPDSGATDTGASDAGTD
ncbi:MAG: hypothetical protein ABI175_14645 [Polyangiales bacterium]